MLTAYVDPPPNLSRAMTRVSNALKKYAPSWVEFVPQDQAQLVFLHVIGFLNVPEVTYELSKRGQRYAVLQYCLKTTQRRRATDWIDIWRNAAVVWSYYDLQAELRLEHYRTDMNFYLAPLGVDDAFRWRPVTQHDTAKLNLAHATRFVVLTSGTMARDQEAIEVCYDIARIVGRRLFHLGPRVPVGMPDINPYYWVSRDGISDYDLCTAYCMTDYVSGLRWTEGFELPVVEGLMCRAKPICFDLPCYRLWFDDLASFVPHDRRFLPHALTKLFTDIQHVPQRHVDQVVERFDWARIVSRFWEMAV